MENATLTRKNFRRSINEEIHSSLFGSSAFLRVKGVFLRLSSTEHLLRQRAVDDFLILYPRAEPTHFVTRTCCSAQSLLRGPFLTYPPVHRALGAAIGPALEAIVASPVAFGPADLRNNFTLP